MAEEKNFSGLLFVGFMFIGGGLGLLFGRPEVGGAVGMGTGFLAMALFRIKGQPVTVSLPATTSGYFLLLAGAFLILGGLSLIYFPGIIYPYLIGSFLALLGLGFMVMGNKIVRLGK